VSNTHKVVDDYDYWLEIAQEFYNMDLLYDRPLSFGYSFSPVWDDDGRLLCCDVVDMYRYLCNKVVSDSTPGLLFQANRFNSNEQVFEKVPGHLMDMVVELLSGLASNELISVEFCRKFGLIHRVFGKKETLERVKIAKKGCRLIMNVPLHVLLVEYLIYGEILESSVELYKERVQCPGMGLDDAGLSILVARFKSVLAHLPPGWKLESDDIGNFDFDVTVAINQASTIYFSKQLGFSETSDWVRIAQRLELAYLICDYSLPNGYIYERIVDGPLWKRHQPTGRAMTACGNSCDRGLMTVAAGGFPVATMGDDHVGVVKEEEYLSRMKDELGFNIKPEEVPKGCIASFCSHWFYEDSHLPSPQNPYKSVYTLLGKTPSVTLYSQLSYELRHCPQRDVCLELVWSSGWMDGLGLTHG